MIVNALQRRADVVAQKSLAESFGLTVAEAMWKGRPVVATRVGGIQDQIEDGRTGCLVEPRDLRGFGERVSALLQDPHAAERMGEAAQANTYATSFSAPATSASTSICSSASSPGPDRAPPADPRASLPVAHRTCSRWRARGGRGAADGRLGPRFKAGPTGMPTVREP